MESKSDRKKSANQRSWNYIFLNFHDPMRIEMDFGGLFFKDAEDTF